MVGVRFWRVALRATRKAGGFEGQCCLSTPVLTALPLQLFAVVSEDCGGNERKIRKVRLSLTFQ